VFGSNENVVYKEEKGNFREVGSEELTKILKELNKEEKF